MITKIRSKLAHNSFTKPGSKIRNASIKIIDKYLDLYERIKYREIYQAVKDQMKDIDRATSAMDEILKKYDIVLDKSGKKCNN